MLLGSACHRRLRGGLCEVVTAECFRFVSKPLCSTGAAALCIATASSHPGAAGALLQVAGRAAYAVSAKQSSSDHKLMVARHAPNSSLFSWRASTSDHCDIKSPGIAQPRAPSAPLPLPELLAFLPLPHAHHDPPSPYYYGQWNGLHEAWLRRHAARRTCAIHSAAISSLTLIRQPRALVRHSFLHRRR